MISIISYVQSNYRFCLTLLDDNTDVNKTLFFHKENQGLNSLLQMFLNDRCNFPQPHWIAISEFSYHYKQII